MLQNILINGAIFGRDTSIAGMIFGRGTSIVAREESRHFSKADPTQAASTNTSSEMTNVSGGSSMGTRGGLNSEHIGLKVEITKNLRLINTNLMDKLDS
jgi:hypothetical protein